MKDILICMKKDIIAVTEYIPLALVVSLCITVVLVFVCKVCKMRLGLLKCAMIFVFFTYLCMLVNITYFSREPGSRDGIDLVVFGTWDQWSQSRAYFMENILLFIPFGIFLPIVWRRMKHLLLVIFLAGIVSVSIEASQYYTGRGYCQIDDVITNVGGAIIGYLMYMIGFCVVWICKKVGRRN